MADRRQWVKLWATWYTTASHLGVGAMALHVGAVLMTCVQWTPGDDEAWAELDTGAPLPVDAIAMRCQATAREVAKALADLQLRGTVAQRADGAWGFRRFGRWQETPDAARKRRGKSADDPTMRAGKSAGFPREEEVEEEAEADQTPPTPASGGRPTSRRGASPRPTPQADPRIDAVLERVDQHRERLGLTALAPSARTPATIAARLKSGATLDELLAVVDAFGRLADREPDKRTVLCATTPFTGPSGSRPGGWAWGLRLLDEERGRPTGRGGDPARIGPALRSVDEVIADRDREVPR